MPLTSVEHAKTDYHNNNKYFTHAGNAAERTPLFAATAVTMSSKAVSRLRIAALFVAALSIAGAARAQKYEGRELVQAALIADSSAVAPGKTFTVGLHLRMVPGWHTYWKYAGDAGIPTEIKWRLPSGWQVGEIEWPLPTKIDEPGDIQIYGYRDEVVLQQRLTPPKNLSGSAVTLAAHASWLVCEKICIPGEADVQVELPIGTNVGPANDQLFSKWRATVPSSWPIDSKASASWSREPGALNLRVKLPGSSSALEFFPLPPASVAIGHPSRISSDAGGDVFRIPLVDANSKAREVGGVIANRTAGVAFELPTETVSAATVDAAAASRAEIFHALLFGFIGGFILNLMPCVLPVISLKIFGFVQQAGKSRRLILRSGLAFAAGIFAWFIGLALVLIVLKSAGRQITWALQFTNPYFVLAMSVFVLVFALNLFGVFEIALPQWATRGVTSGSNREGDSGSFLQGVFATVLATPCTAPFLGTALGFAFTQSALIIMAVFVAIAAGMSAPYIALAAQPAWLRFLPKPGDWMVRVKQAMGFLLIATLIFLLAVIGAQRGVGAIVWTTCLLLAVSIACWIKGVFIVPMASARSRVVASFIAIALLIASTAYFVGSKFSRESETAAQTNSAEGWQTFTPALLQTELQQRHAIFLDFTAAWCITCKFNEATVLETAAVRDSLAKHGITKIKADWTNANPEITKLLKQFGRPGVPLYVLYPGNGAEPYIFPELITKNMVLAKLESISPNLASK